MVTKHERLVTYISMLGAGGFPAKSYEGLCNNVSDMFNVTFKGTIFKGYPDHSGDHVYPVKGVLQPPGEEYESTYFMHGNQWIGEYGDNRRKFCKWVAKNITPEWYY